jgi:hypothetical protein
MKILFLHGWNSKSGSVKPTHLATQGHEIIDPTLHDDDFAAAVRTAQAEYDRHQPDVVVGSSRGGAVAMNMRVGETPLVLLCPAWKKYGTVRVVKFGSVVLHSRADDVVPFPDTEELVRASGLPASALIEVGSDHRLADPEPLAAMLGACLATRPRVAGSDFGVPRKAGDQAKKIILVEAVRLGQRHYAVEPSGRNARLVHDYASGAPWKERRRGWTLPDLAAALSADPSVKVAAFDFPFSIPVALLGDAGFARLLGQAPFGNRGAWAQFVSSRLRLAFDGDSPDAEMRDLAHFDPWRDKRFWIRRATDTATNGSPPLKHKFQNVFAMTLAGTALLERLGGHGCIALLDSATPASPRCMIETYPRAVASRVGFSGSYKAAPDKCLTRAEQFLKERGIKIDIDEDVRHFCETYRTSGDDPDGADAFLCLVAAIACFEGMAEICAGQAAKAVLREEGIIVVPKSVAP